MTTIEAEMDTLAPQRPGHLVTHDRARVFTLYERVQWYELALLRHGYTIERLMRLSHRVANDGLRARGATLGDRYDDLVSRLQMAGLQATMRYDPSHSHTGYGRNGGDPFTSYVSDIMGKRIDDHFRSKSEGFGDRRYGNDNRVVLSDDPDPADHDLDFDLLVDERRRAKWQEAAGRTQWNLSEWIVITLDRAAKEVLCAA